VFLSCGAVTVLISVVAVEVAFPSMLEVLSPALGAMTLVVVELLGAMLIDLPPAGLCGLAVARVRRQRIAMCLVSHPFTNQHAANPAELFPAQVHFDVRVRCQESAAPSRLSQPEHTRLRGLQVRGAS
jgi:hypothetical protein